MVLKDETTGVSVSLTYDGDGFPLIAIDTGGGFYAQHGRPTVEVRLNDHQIHDMFDDNDVRRWD